MNKAIIILIFALCETNFAQYCDENLAENYNKLHNSRVDNSYWLAINITKEIKNSEENLQNKVGSIEDEIKKDVKIEVDNLKKQISENHKQMDQKIDQKADILELKMDGLQSYKKDSDNIIKTTMKNMATDIKNTLNELKPEALTTSLTLEINAKFILHKDEINGKINAVKGLVDDPMDKQNSAKTIVDNNKEQIKVISNSSDVTIGGHSGNQIQCRTSQTNFHS